MSAEELVDDIDESLEVTPYDYSITKYGAEYTVESLVKRIDSGEIVGSAGTSQVTWPLVNDYYTRVKKIVDRVADLLVPP